MSATSPERVVTNVLYRIPLKVALPTIADSAGLKTYMRRRCEDVA